MIDLRGYRVIWGDKVLNALALDVVDFGKEIDISKNNKTIEKPIFLGVLAINADGNIVRICDEAWCFQFIPIISGEGSRQ